MSASPLRRRGYLVAAIATTVFASMVVPEVEAAPTPGARCTQRGQEQVVKSRTLRCTRVRTGGLRWRVITPAPKPGVASTISTPRAPRVSGVSANESRVSFTLSDMSPDSGNYAIQWVVKGASFSSYQMIRATSRNVSVSTDEFRCDLTYTMRVFVMRSDWTGDRGHTTENITPHSDLFDVAMNHPCRGGAADVVASCAEGGECALGEVGPGGGTVFYVEPSGGTFACGRALQSRCRYLEAAPTTGTNAWTDATYAWSGITNVAIGTDARGTGIGTGYMNTIAMATQSNTASRAGTVSRAYRGPQFMRDWYLPSKDELNQLYLRREIVGGFTAATYWSSSEIDATDPWVHGFGTGSQGSASKAGPFRVRPIRAFGGAAGCADGGACVVGDTGPGGGVIFYVASSEFSSPGSDCSSYCLYLEAAPRPSGGDISLTWATGSNQSQFVSGADGTAIGTGRQNTLDIRAQTGNVAASSAAMYAYEFTTEGATDWFLPSSAELNLMSAPLARSATGVTIGSSSWYWSSSEATYGSGDLAVVRWLADGSLGTANKNEARLFRPIRAVISPA